MTSMYLGVGTAVQKMPEAGESRTKPDQLRQGAGSLGQATPYGPIEPGTSAAVKTHAAVGMQHRTRDTHPCQRRQPAQLSLGETQPRIAGIDLEGAREHHGLGWPDRATAHCDGRTWLNVYFDTGPEAHQETLIGVCDEVDLDVPQVVHQL